MKPYRTYVTPQTSQIARKASRTEPLTQKVIDPALYKVVQVRDPLPDLPWVEPQSDDEALLQKANLGTEIARLHGLIQLELYEDARNDLVTQLTKYQEKAAKLKGPPTLDIGDSWGRLGMGLQE